MEIALYRPEIPPNTGNIARLSVCTGSRLHIIGEPSFSMDAAAVRRAGLDYWDQVDLHLHTDWEHFLDYVQSKAVDGRKPNLILVSKHGKKVYCEHSFQKDDICVFGQESSGLPDVIFDSVLREHPEFTLKIPVKKTCRSLNLSNAVAIIVYESLRQLAYTGVI